MLHEVGKRRHAGPGGGIGGAGGAFAGKQVRRGANLPGFQAGAPLHQLGAERRYGGFQCGGAVAAHVAGHELPVLPALFENCAYHGRRNGGIAARQGLQKQVRMVGGLAPARIDADQFQSFPFRPFQGPGGVGAEYRHGGV